MEQPTDQFKEESSPQRWNWEIQLDELTHLIRSVQTSDQPANTRREQKGIAMYFLSRGYADIHSYEGMKSTYLARYSCPSHGSPRHTVPWMSENQIQNSLKTMGKCSEFCETSASRAMNHNLYLEHIKVVIIVSKGLSRSFRHLVDATIQLITSHRDIESNMQTIEHTQSEIPTGECLPSYEDTQGSLDTTDRVSQINTRGERIYPMVDYVVVQSYPTGVRFNFETNPGKQNVEHN